MNKIGQFAVLYSQTNWGQYKAELSDQLTEGYSQKYSVEFPDGPDAFPCLVATTPVKTDPAKSGTISFLQVHCCFVYPSDAQRLLEAVSQLEQSIVVDGMVPEVEEEYVPSPMGILLLSLVLELESLGAVKQDRLLTKIKEVEKWLVDKQTDNTADSTLEETLKRLWRDHSAH